MLNRIGKRGDLLVFQSACRNDFHVMVRTQLREFRRDVIEQAFAQSGKFLIARRNSDWEHRNALSYRKK